MASSRVLSPPGDLIHLIRDIGLKVPQPHEAKVISGGQTYFEVEGKFILESGHKAEDVVGVLREKFHANGKVVRRPLGVQLKSVAEESTETAYYGTKEQAASQDGTHFLRLRKRKKDGETSWDIDWKTKSESRGDGILVRTEMKGVELPREKIPELHTMLQKASMQELAVVKKSRVNLYMLREEQYPVKISVDLVKGLGKDGADAVVLEFEIKAEDRKTVEKAVSDLETIMKRLPFNGKLCKESYLELMQKRHKK